MTERPLILFDLDGTLALIDHRRHLVQGKHKQWDAFYLACVDDQPNLPVIKLMKLLWREGEHDLWIVSGRSDLVRKETIAWLDTYTHSQYHRLFMRPHGDTTPDDVLKRAWVEPVKERVRLVFDDRDKVVSMWRAMGLSCFQVAEGMF